VATRKDSIGLFWQDEVKIKAPPKVKVKRLPPERFWEHPDYLPELAEALAYQPDLYSDIELLAAWRNKEKLLFDIEVYPNYCLFAFKGQITGKVVYFEIDATWQQIFDIEKLRWIMANFCLINFNGRKYDFPVTAVGLAGGTTEDMWEATKMIIEQQLQAQEVYKRFKVESLKCNQIDLIELTAGAPGLKVCAARLHAPRLQDLPFKPGTHLTPNQIKILIRYCINDLDNTGILYQSTIKQIELRESQGKKYKIELRSHSDAQMAESIMSAEIKRITGRKFIARTKIEPGTSYHFKTPRFIKFESALMQHTLKVIQNATFTVGYDGSIILPPEIAESPVKMAKASYQMGIGGLHSQEKSIAHVADENYFIADTDATSYYPKLILNAGMTPKGLGKDFLVVYNGIVVERVNAKRAGNIVVAECLKIVANGSFGKLGSMWSIMYAPDLMMQVTVTGQLSIFMLAERFELRGIEVISINTDGIVVKCLRSKEDEFKSIVKAWEKDTGFETEEIRYKATYSRDINNYLAVYEEPQKGKLFKTKGAYAETSSKKNAINEVCMDAVKEYLATGKPVDHTIRECKQISMFTSMRRAVGGAVKGDKYLGSILRWYYAVGEQGEIINAKSGNKIARTEGAKPLMDLPAEFPTDIDYDWYVIESNKILQEIGYTLEPV
jgi:hypothetical protein